MALDRAVSQGGASGRPGGADDPARRLYDDHRLELVRLGVQLVGDVGRAEELVQEAFARFRSGRGAGPRRRRSDLLGDDEEDALEALRAGTVRAADRWATAAPAVGAPGAVAHALPSPPTDPEAPDPLGRHRQLLDRLEARPMRERQVLVLRYGARMPDGRIADALGVRERLVAADAARALAALAGATVGVEVEEAVTDALACRADLVDREDLRDLSLPQPAPRSRLPWLLTAAGVAVVIVGATLLDPSAPPGRDTASGDAGSAGIIGGPAGTGGSNDPPGSVRMDVNGDARDDVVSVVFDGVAHTYRVYADVAGVGLLRHQGLALDPPTLVGAVDLDADYSDEIAVNVGDDTRTMPEFFRFTEDRLVRLRTPVAGEVVNGWDPRSALTSFGIRFGRLYTWRLDPTAPPDLGRVTFWRWGLVGEDRLEPGEVEERCLPLGREFPSDCAFIR